MPRPNACAAALFVALLAGCGEETGERATRVAVSPRVTTTIEVGPKGQVSSLLFAEGALWVAGWRSGSSTVQRIDPGTNEIAVRIPVEGVPGGETGGEGMAVGAGAVWVAGGTSGEAVLERIDPSTNDVVATIRLGGRSAADVAVDDIGVWVSVFGNDGGVKVVRVDPATNRVLAAIPVEGDWIREIFAFDGAVLVRGLGGGDDPTSAHERWTVIDPATSEVIASRRGNLENGPFVAWNGVVWAGAGRELVRIDPRTAQLQGKAIHVGSQIGYASLVAAKGGLWFVGSKPGGEPTKAAINRFNTATSQIDVSLEPPKSPIALAAAPGSVWMLNYEGSVTRIDLH